MNKNAIVALLVVFACGCAVPPNNHSNISAALETRAAQTLGESKPGEFTLPPQVSLADGLSEEEAVSLALWNNAAFLETLADLGLSRADLIVAGMLPNPTFSMLIPVGAKPLELTAKYPLEILWLRPRRVAAGKLDYEKTAQRLTQNGLDVIRDTKLAFADLALADERARAAEQSATLAEQIGNLATARLRAGEASELDVSTAAVDALQTQEQLTRSRHDQKIAAERLRAFVGMGQQPFPVRIVPGADPRLNADVNVLVTNALAARPDLRAAELGLEAAGKRIGLARAEAFTFAVALNSKEIGKDFLSGPGVDLAVPIVNQNQGGVAVAKANLEKTARHYFAVRDRIVLDVREAHARFVQAQESFDTWQRRILPPLQESVRQAQKAYETGDVALLFVLEASRKLEDARTKAAAVRADLHRAAAELERSIGGRLSAASAPLKEDSK